MHNLVIILEFIGGLLLLFAIGWIFGYLFRLENPHYETIVHIIGFFNSNPRTNLTAINFLFIKYATVQHFLA